MSQFAKQIVVSTCVMFTLFMAVSSVAVIIATGPQYGLVMTLTLLLASGLFAALRGLWFTDRVIRKLAYPLRILGFGITGFVALAACALLGGWFPADNPWAWGTFAVIFLITLGAFCLGYQIYFRRTVGNFDAALRQYHQKMGR